MSDDDQAVVAMMGAAIVCAVAMCAVAIVSILVERAGWLDFLVAS